MSRKQRKPKGQQRSVSRRGGDANAIPVLGLIAALIVALLMLRYLVPAESAAEGHTLWIVQGWLAVALLWSANCLVTRRCSIRFGRFDVAVWLLVMAHVVAALAVVLTEGHKRAAINMLWEWIGLGVSYFLVRQMLRTAADQQHVLNSFVVVFVALAGLGLWQHYVWYPSASKEYQELRSELNDLNRGTVRGLTGAQMRRRAEEIQLEFDRQGIPRDPESLALWEQRLNSSSEPFALFALANTFAGLLAMGLIILLDAALRTRGSPSFWTLWLPGTFLVAFCLILTKSRSAWIGLLAGLTFLLFQYFKQHNRWSIIPNAESADRHQQSEERSRTNTLRVRKHRSRGEGGRSRFVWAVAFLAVVGVFVGIATLSGGIDHAVLSEAKKSLNYRVEFWTGTWEVIKERPVLGTGPGNFRQHYLKYKLPESSEEIAAPHNFVLDVWSNGGSVSLCALLVFVAAAVRLSTQIPSRAVVGLLDSEAVSDTRGSRFVSLGTLASFAILLFGDWTMGQQIDLRIVALMAAVVVLCLMLSRYAARSYKNNSSNTSHSALAAAGLALLIHLLAADGIAMPAVTQSLLLLFACLVSRNECETAKSGAEANAREEPPNVRSVRRPIMVCGGLSLLLSVLCLMTATLPVLKRNIMIQLSDTSLYEQHNSRRAMSYLGRAAEADPFSPIPLQRLAELTYRESKITTSEAGIGFGQATELAELAIENDPFSSNGYRKLGNWYFQRYQRFGNMDDAVSAVKSFQKSLERYPNNARLVAEFATALSGTADVRASQMAVRALELDQINRQAGHRDRFLPDDIRAALGKISGKNPQKSLSE